MTPEFKGFLLVSIVKMLVVFSVVMVGVALLTLMERKVSAWMQNRLGPNRVGFAGLLQPAADGLKNIIKEETRPPFANKFLFVLAPALAFIPALCLSAVIPFAAPLPLNSDDFGTSIANGLPLIGKPLGAIFHFILGRVSYNGNVPMVVADLPIGFLFVIAISSLGVYGIALAGWSSNSKYSLLGGLRASAQMVSYEVAMGLSLIPVLLLSGNVSFSAIIANQQHGVWYVLPLFLSFFVFLVSGFAETNRVPFDMPEAESELIAGYHTEYSAMKFSLFFIAEYSNMVTVSGMVASLFFGGWDIPFTSWDQTHAGLVVSLLTFMAFFAKVFFFLFLFMWIRWTLPRFRFDQLMALGWKVMIPLALAYVMVIAVAIYVIEDVLKVGSVRVEQLILAGLSLALGFVVFFLLDRNTVISGSQRRRGALARAASAAPDAK